MGLNLNCVKLLFEAKAAGVSFKKTLTLGRQWFSCHRGLFAEMAAQYGYSPQDLVWLGNAGPQYSDDFFKMLGAEEVVALDYSDYEGARMVFDLNQPIDLQYTGSFDVVFDGGTLEHIFNFPVAIKSCLDLVKCEGRFLTMTPANNYCGHGFYQFSPELFFRILTADNGFVVEKTIVWEENTFPIFYEVKDPAQIKQRVELVTQYPVLLMVRARKTHQVDRLAAPQQSDYTQLWKQGGAAVPNARPLDNGGLRSLKKRVLRYVFEHYPHISKPLLALGRWRQVKRLSLMRQEHGFKRLGELSTQKEDGGL